MASTLKERLLQTAHDFELHNPGRGIIFRGCCDVEAIRLAADTIDRLTRELSEADKRIAEIRQALEDGDESGAYLIALYHDGHSLATEGD